MYSRLTLFLLASALFAADKVSKPGEYAGYSEPLYSAWVRSSQ